jgi:uncharacterized protein YwlG (UPF0340 family)
MLLDLPTAKAHLRVDNAADDALITLYINAAEQSAAEHLNRRLYVDQAALTAAVAAVPAVLAVASATYAAAVAAALLMVDLVEQDAATVDAEQSYTAAQTVARETRAGMVINDVIKAAILLMLGDMYASREDTVIGVSVSPLPTGARALMRPYRAGMGV